MSAPGRTGNPKSRQQAQSKDDQQIKLLGDGWISGHVGQDPELKYTSTGRAVCNVSIAHTPRSKNEQTGKWEDGRTVWYRADVWGDQGENIAECIRKGDRVIVGGEFRERTYTNRDGEEVTVQEITARDIGPSLLFGQVTVKRRQRSRGHGTESEG